MHIEREWEVGREKREKGGEKKKKRKSYLSKRETKNDAHLKYSWSYICKIVSLFPNASRIMKRLTYLQRQDQEYFKTTKEHPLRKITKGHPLRNARKGHPSRKTKKGHPLRKTTKGTSFEKGNKRNILWKDNRGTSFPNKEVDKQRGRERYEKASKR